MKKNGVYRYSVSLRRAVCDVTRITVRMRRSIVLVLWDSVRNKCSIYCNLFWSYFYPTIVISYIWTNVFIHMVLLWIGVSQAKLTMWFIHLSQNTHESFLYGIIHIGSKRNRASKYCKLIMLLEFGVYKVFNRYAFSGIDSHFLNNAFDIYLQLTNNF